MLRLLFTTQDKSKQLTVITDGIDSQLNVFVTENTVGDVDYFKSLGIMILPGHVYNIGTLKEWAFNNALILISYPEGLNEEAQILIDVTEEIRYIFTAKTAKLSFPNVGGDEEAVVTSYKQKYVNGKPSGSQIALEVTFETASPYSVSKGGTVTISENPTDQVRNGILKVTQSESNKVLNISLTQAASEVKYSYILTATPTDVNFVNTGEFKTVDITHTKQKLVNNKPSGSPIKVGYDIEIAGVGFDYEVISGGVNVSATENPGTSKRTGTLNISSQESENTATINLTQAAGTVTYEYTLSVDPDALNFVAAGETKTFGVSSKKQKKINGKDSGAAIVVDYTTVVSGTGFSKGSSEYSVIAEANTGDQRSGQAVVTASEGGKTVTVTLIQDAGASA